MLPPIIILGALLWGCSSDPDPLFSSLDSDGPDVKPERPDTSDSLDNDSDFETDEPLTPDGGDSDIPDLVIPPETISRNETSDADSDTPDSPETTILPPDKDGDNYYVCSTPAEELAVLNAGGLCGDCDDANPNTYPGAKEYWDGKNNDCGGKALSLENDACEIIGENQDHRFAMGDVDGDGVDDLVVADPFYYGDSGRISVKFGATDICFQGGKQFADDFDVHIYGGCSWSLGGHILITDTNNDGIQDIFASTSYDNGECGGKFGDGDGSGIGGTMVFRGRLKGDWLPSYDFIEDLSGSKEADLASINANILQGAGGVQRAKDIDGDGVDELVFTRADKAKLEIIPVKDYIGIQSIGQIAKDEGHRVFNTIPEANSIDFATGDFNGDGLGDITATKVNNQFEDVFVIYGQDDFPPYVDIADQQSMQSVDYRILRTEKYGSALGLFASTGNIFGAISNLGHEIDDLVLGACIEDIPFEAAGRVHVLAGSDLSLLSSGSVAIVSSKELLPNGVTINSTEANSCLGIPVIADGDLNGDGLNDLVAGTEHLNGSVGIRSVFTGATLLDNGGTEITISDADETVNGANPPRFIGAAVCNGDINHDGFDDCIFATTTSSDFLFFGKGND